MAVFISIDDVWVSEGDPGATFTVRLSEPSLTQVSLIWGVVNGSAGTTDFAGVRDQSLVFDAGEVEKTIFVALEQDTSVEGAETVRVVLREAVGGTLTRNAGNAVIVDDDTVSAAPRISVSDVVVDETGNANVIVRLDSASTSPVSVSFATSGDSATAGSDFTGVSGTLTFNPGEVVKSVSVGLVDKAAVERTERFFFNLSNASGGEIAQSRATITILTTTARRSRAPSFRSMTSGSARARTTPPSPSASPRRRRCPSR